MLIDVIRSRPAARRNVLFVDAPHGPDGALGEAACSLSAAIAMTGRPPLRVFVGTAESLDAATQS